MHEAPAHPHNRARGTFVQRDGVAEPAPAPRFTRTSSELPPQAPAIGGQTEALMRELGCTEVEIEALRGAGVVYQA